MPRNVFANLVPPPSSSSTSPGGGGGSTFGNDRFQHDGLHLPFGAIIGIVLGCILLVAVAIIRMNKDRIRRRMGHKRRCRDAESAFRLLENADSSNSSVSTVAGGPIHVDMKPVLDWPAYESLAATIEGTYPGYRLTSFIYDCEEHGRTGNFLLEFPSFYDLALDEHGRLEPSRYRFLHSTSSSPAGSETWDDETLSSAFTASDRGTILVSRQSLCQVCVIKYAGPNATRFEEELMAFATLRRINERTFDVVVFVARDPKNNGERNECVERILANRNEVVHCTKWVDLTLESELMCIKLTQPTNLERIANVCKMPEKQDVVSRELKQICRPSIGGNVNHCEYNFAVELTVEPSRDHPFIAEISFQTACKNKDPERIRKLPVRYAPDLSGPVTSAPAPPAPLSPSPRSPDGGVLLSALGSLLASKVFMQRSWTGVAGRMGYSSQDIQGVIVEAEAKRNPRSTQFLVLHLNRFPDGSAEQFAGLLAALEANADVVIVRDSAGLVPGCRFNESLFNRYLLQFRKQDRPTASSVFSSEGPLPPDPPTIDYDIPMQSLHSPSLRQDFASGMSFATESQAFHDAPTQPLQPHSQPHALRHFPKEDS